MFETLVFEQLNKLVETEIGDFASPDTTFHAVKVERFYSDSIKAPAEGGSEFPLPIKTLIANPDVKACELSNSTIVVSRPFHFATDRLVQFAELLQRLFEKLRTFYFITITQRQERFDTEIYPYALTCSRKGFGRRIICHDEQVVIANSISADLDIAHIAVPVAMLMEREPGTVKFQGLRSVIPRLKRKTDTPVFKFVACLELGRTIAMFPFRFRNTALSSKEALVNIMDTDYSSVKRISRYPRPMFLRCLEQLRQMRLQAIPARVFAIDAVIPLLQTQKMDTFLPQWRTYRDELNKAPLAHENWRY